MKELQENCIKYDFDEIIDRHGTNCMKWDLSRGMVERGVINQINDDTIIAFNADMDFRCATPIIEAVKRVADHGIYGYTAVEASEKYYDAVISWFRRRYDWNIKKEWIYYANGTLSGIKLLLQATQEKGSGVIVMTPVYDPFFEAIELAGCTVKYCPLIHDDKGYYTIDFQLLEEMAKKKDNNALLFCNPHNPVGRVWNEEELRRVYEICAKNQILILSDEVHGDLTRKGITYHPFAKVVNNAPEVIGLTAVNKSFNLAGLHISNMIISDETIRKKYLNLVGMFNIEPTPFAIEALIAAYTESDDWLSQVRDYLDESIEWAVSFLHENLPKVVCYQPEGTYILWMDFSKTGYTPEEVHEKIYNQANILIADGSKYDPVDGKNYQRICLPISREKVKEAFFRIKKVFE